MNYEYTKPIDKDGKLIVEFQIGDFRQAMLLARIPKPGESFHDPSQKEAIITKVIYKPWNQDMPDVVVEGKYVRTPEEYLKLLKSLRPTSG